LVRNTRPGAGSLGNGQRVAVDYEPKSKWFGLGGFRVSMAHDVGRAWLRARRALDRLDLDDPDGKQEEIPSA
jgi:ribosomal protein L34